MSDSETERRRYESPVGRFRATFAQSEDGVLECSGHGYETVEAARDILAILGEYRRASEQGLLVLLDATEMTGSDPEARGLLQGGLHDESLMRRLAEIGGNRFSRTLYNLYARIAKIPMQVVRDEAQGLEFLGAEPRE